jgi:hypothetical protein
MAYRIKVAAGKRRCRMLFAGPGSPRAYPERYLIINGHVNASNRAPPVAPRLRLSTCEANGYPQLLSASQQTSVFHQHLLTTLGINRAWIA